MSKYLTLFDTQLNYLTFKNGDSFITPNVSLVTSDMSVHYNPFDPINGHSYVEIAGLKWATMNVGATSETDAGLYFQWGDTQGYTASQVGSGSGQKAFTWADYKYSNNGGSTEADMTKYNLTDGKKVLDLEDDAAHVNMGGNWRMPTYEELQIFKNAVNVTYVTDYNGSGVNGTLCTDKNDSVKKLFFPYTLSYMNSQAYSEYGYIWSSSLLRYYGTYFTNNDVRDSYILDMGYGYQDSDFIFYASRYYGCSVRGVLDEPGKIINFTINSKSYQAENGMTWEQWVTSKYNVVENPYTGTGSENNGNWYISNNNVHLTTSSTNGISVKNINEDFVLSSDKITGNYAYIANNNDEEAG